MNYFSLIDQDLKKFAESIPGKGMHISYLNKATKLMELYGEASSIMEEEETPANEALVKKVAEKVEELVK